MRIYNIIYSNDSNESTSINDIANNIIKKCSNTTESQKMLLKVCDEILDNTKIPFDNVIWKESFHNVLKCNYYFSVYYIIFID